MLRFEAAVIIPDGPIEIHPHGQDVAIAANQLTGIIRGGKKVFIESWVLYHH